MYDVAYDVTELRALEKSIRLEIWRVLGAGGGPAVGTNEEVVT